MVHKIYESDQELLDSLKEDHKLLKEMKLALEETKVSLEGDKLVLEEHKAALEAEKVVLEDQQIALEGREVTKNEQLYAVPVSYDVVAFVKKAEVDGVMMKVIEVTDLSPRWSVIRVKVYGS
jgi:hypothetical protein